MLFNSYEFLWFFLPVVAIGFVVTRAFGVSQAMAWLLGCSLFFYGWWNPPYVLLLGGSVIFNYAMQRQISRNGSVLVVAFSVLVNLGVLVYFKYANFFLSIANYSTDFQFSFANVALPLAISFFTFQQVAYLCDTYSGRVVDHTFLEYAMFVIFFPQLIAGPVVNQREILPQFKKRRALSPRAVDVAAGVTIFSIGLFKKVVIADTMAKFATPVFDGALAADDLSFIEAWTGALAYTFQLYFDFSGYSDMAVGLARLFGIKLPINFNSPYKATSIVEFWRRWHITLSRFLRDYLYIPLGGGHAGSARRYINLMIVMLLGGLWHGAGWSFVLWGGLHGVYLAFNHSWSAFLRICGVRDLSNGRIYAAIAWLITFLAVVFAWVLFRAESLEAALHVYRAMFGFNGVQIPDRLLALSGPIRHVITFVGIEARPSGEFEYWRPVSAVWIVMLIFAVLLMPNSSEWLARYGKRTGPKSKLLSKRTAWRPTFLYGFVVLCLFLYTMFKINDAPSEFLYFQF